MRNICMHAHPFDEIQGFYAIDTAEGYFGIPIS